mmetsp:Transcript_51932/g.111017  ORF Transcript_51932/g.111017 Transcript_51932/m.111017 type:complete len:212 (+) Transcript_51932:1012-1647(+)
MSPVATSSAAMLCPDSAEAGSALSSFSEPPSLLSSLISMRVRPRSLAESRKEASPVPPTVAGALADSGAASVEGAGAAAAGAAGAAWAAFSGPTEVVAPATSTRPTATGCFTGFVASPFAFPLSLPAAALEPATTFVRSQRADLDLAACAPAAGLVGNSCLGVPRADPGTNSAALAESAPGEIGAVKPGGPALLSSAGGRSRPPEGGAATA